ncbi:cob(I)yrinic acid a,c-diamide adenosyltransferase [Candidatus Woesearchaeota archaeon]|nr:cob(I)yrinic acid a,c-diamide adenosyltransferase [Candidatus Woesearchaeota archaeon]
MNKKPESEILNNIVDPSVYGMVHAIYGRGKDKTCAAIGIAIRAAGYGLKVAFVQFMKDGKSNERTILANIPQIDYFCPGEHEWADLNIGLVESQKRHALSCLEHILQLPYTTNLLVCDEILNVPLYGSRGNRPFTYSDIGEFITKCRKSNLELVLTGLCCPGNLLELVDYASEIREVKHPFQQGIQARAGIEY